MNEMNKYLDKENISITTTLTFHSSGDDLDNKMKQLKVTKNRIFIGLKTKNWLCSVLKFLPVSLFRQWANGVIVGLLPKYSIYSSYFQKMCAIKVDLDVVIAINLLTFDCFRI